MPAACEILDGVPRRNELLEELGSYMSDFTGLAKDLQNAEAGNAELRAKLKALEAEKDEVTAARDAAIEERDAAKGEAEEVEELRTRLANIQAGCEEQMEAKHQLVIKLRKEKKALHKEVQALKKEVETSSSSSSSSDEESWKFWKRFWVVNRKIVKFIGDHEVSVKDLAS